MSGTFGNASFVDPSLEQSWRSGGTEAFGRSGGQSSEIQAFESAIEDLLKALEDGSAVGGGGSSASMPNSFASDSVSPSAPPPGSTGPSPTGPGGTSLTGIAPTGTTPAGTSSTGTSPSDTGASSSGAVVNIDGGNADGVGVVEKVDNNTGAAAKFGWENSSGQLVGVLNLRNGQSGEFDVNAAGSDGKSARLIELNPDGTVPAQSNLDEQNVTLNPNGTMQNSPDVSEITAGSDPTKITITDGNGKTVGNGAPGGAYWYPTQDQQTNPADNPMTMAMDTSDFYNNDFTG